MSATTLAISDMHCSACVGKVEQLLAQQSRVEAFMVNPFRREIYLTHDDRYDPLQLLVALEQLGFSPTLIEQRAQVDQQHRSRELKRIGIAGICAMQVMMASLALHFGEFWGMTGSVRQLLAWTSMLLCVPLVGYCAQPFFAGALRALRRGVSMDLPIAMAITIAFAVSVQHTVAGIDALYYDSVAMFVFLLLLARFYDARLRRELSAEDRLRQLLPQTVTVPGAAGPVEVPAASVLVGDRLWVAEGALIPADARLLDAHALIDESLLSGEVDWVQKQQGDDVYAGTHNRGAAFTVEVQALPERSRAAEIQTLSARISLNKAPLARLADRVATVFVPTILLLAALTYALHSLAVGGLAPSQALSAALAVLIVSCPCALALAIPAATAAALIRARRLGVLLADSGLLEQLSTIRQVLLDKTGTLLAPQLTLTAVTLHGAWSAAACYRLAAAVQQHSSHPLAAGFKAETLPPAVIVHPAVSAETERPMEAPVEADWTLTSIESVPGAGLRATLQYAGESLPLRIGSAAHCEVVETDGTNLTQRVYLTLGAALLAEFDLSAELRGDAEVAVARLRQSGRTLAILSGDSNDACARISDALSIDAYGALSPEQKRETLLELRATGGPAMFVGDGINDSLAFAEADIAVATLETTDYVQANADAVLLSSRLEALPDLFALADRVRRVIRQNLAWALGYNLLVIPLAMLGLVQPWVAALGMASSSLLVMINASRILRFSPPPASESN